MFQTLDDLPSNFYQKQNQAQPNQENPHKHLKTERYSSNQ